MSRAAAKHARHYEVFKASVLKWYTRERWMAVFPYINGDVFSRRFIEHFITEYARSHCCEYPLKDPFTGDVTVFNVYHSAQTVLAGVHKRHMDPFGRRNNNAENGGKFPFGYGKHVCTVSVCVLVFFRWALKHNVLEYAKEHQEDIKKDMADMARFKRTDSRRVEEVVIELPENSEVSSTAAAALHPLQDEYWQESTSERKQQPKKKRKRYRESAVSMVMNNDCVVTGVF